MSKEINRHRKVLIINCLLCFLVTSCNNNPPIIEAEVIKDNCQSFNMGDTLSEKFLSSNKNIQLNLPVARRKSEHSFSVVLLPSSDKSGIFWVRKNKQGEWYIAEKQTVVKIGSDKIDASPMHRLVHNEEQEKIILFITIPSTYEKTINIQPVLENSEFRWGNLLNYRTQIRAIGFKHPFSGLEKGFSGEKLPANLAEVVNKVQNGSIYVPDIYKRKISLLEPTVFNPKLCPIAGL